MSRVGKLPITIPAGVTVKVEGSKVSAKGPKGELSLSTRPEVKVSIKDNSVIVERVGDDKISGGFHGLYRQLINNMVIGVSTGFTKVLLVNGVGYRMETSGNVLTLHLGYSMPIEYMIPEGITITAEGNNKITISGIDKCLVGKTAAEIRSLRKTEPYKGKGIKYEDEVIRRKVGKSGGK